MSGRVPTDISHADRYPRIVKGAGRPGLCPNLADYEQMRREFNWEVARALLDGLPGGQGLNIAHEAVDRHADGPRAERHALRWIGRTGNRRVFTYRDLKAETNRFANALRNLGVREGESVFVLAGRIPELYIAVLGSPESEMRRIATVLCVRAGAHGDRLTIGAGRVLVTTEPLYRRKVAGDPCAAPTLEHVILVPEEADAQTSLPDTLDWQPLVETQNPEFAIPPTSPQDRALLHFTSGTTGTAKGRDPRARGGGDASRHRPLRA